MPEGDGEQLNVLVIDDDPALRELVVQIVSTNGHQAVPAPSAEAGLELLPFWTFQVAFIDHNLPGMEGLVLGEYLRNHNPDMTIALVTGEDDPRIERRSRDLSIVFVPKPFEPGDILDVIRAYQDGAREREERRHRREEPDYGPPMSSYAEEIAACFDIPGVPERIEDRLVKTVKRSLNNLRSVSRYTERDRVVALSGLIACRVLGVDLPRTDSGRTLYEEYDELMRTHGRRTEFGRPGSRPPPAF